MILEPRHAHHVAILRGHAARIEATARTLGELFGRGRFNDERMAALLAAITSDVAELQLHRIGLETDACVRTEHDRPAPPRRE